MKTQRITQITVTLFFALLFIGMFIFQWIANRQELLIKLSE